MTVQHYSTRQLTTTNTDIANHARSLRAPVIRVTDHDTTVEESPLRDPRSDNSLAYLCTRFCELYRDQDTPINIDHAAKELSIQRRRMYEILNIIQSVGLVVRLRASFYRWEGNDNMAVTLERLKQEGMQRLANNIFDSTFTPPRTAVVDGQRRKAVATALGERFVQIFLCNEVPPPIILEDIMGLFSSCVDGGNSTMTNQMSCARRLYDIANVFCSIGLVQKACSVATDHRRKKRLYTWTGPIAPLATPVRPQRTTITAPNVSPGSSSAKRTKREETSRETRTSRKKGKTSLEDCIIKAEASVSTPPLAPMPSSLQHPAVSALIARNSGRSSPTLSSNDKLSSRDHHTFNPTNAKDTTLVDLTNVTESTTYPTSSDAPSTPVSQPVCTRVCSCSSAADAMDSPMLLRAQVQHLTQALQEAQARERELLKRIEMQDSQINKLIDCKVSTTHASDRRLPTVVVNTNSPITNFVFPSSPFHTSALARDPFSLSASTGVSPSPSSSLFSGSSFFSTGLTGPPSGAGRSRPPFIRKARIGPQLVDPAAGDDSTDSKGTMQALIPHTSGASASQLSPATTSLASSLLLSPIVPNISSQYWEKEKENQRSVDRLLASPALPPVSTSTSQQRVPSTPPCPLLATAASSLLSLTPTQMPSFSPSLPSYFHDRRREDSDEEETLSSNPQKHTNETLDVIPSSSMAFTSSRLLASPASLATAFDQMSSPPQDMDKNTQPSPHCIA